MLPLLCLAVPAAACPALLQRDTQLSCVKPLMPGGSVSGQHQQSQHQHQQRGLSSVPQGTANHQQHQQAQHQLRGALPATQGAGSHQQLSLLQAERDTLQQR